MKRKKASLLSVLITASILFMAACSNGQTTTAATPETSPTSSSGNSAPSDSGDLHLDPANADPKVYPALANMYESLVKDDGGEIKGVLAESFTTSEDGLDYIFNLRPGVTFHDGQPLNAEAVIANFDRWFDPASATRGTGAFQAWATAFGGFKGEVTDTNTPKSIYDGIEKVDGLTVLVHLNTADPEFLKKISSPAFSIVSPASLESGAGDGGSGPYQFASFVDADTTIKLDPFAGYWDTASIPGQSMEVSIK
jgi:peptide/nickel transport system substrate-binding protein